VCSSATASAGTREVQPDGGVQEVGEKIWERRPQCGLTGLGGEGSEGEDGEGGHAAKQQAVEGGGGEDPGRSVPLCVDIFKHGNVIKYVGFISHDMTSF
jgi:hypothetical protein